MDYIDGEIGSNKSEYAASFFIKIGQKLAIAEMTFMDKVSATNYLEMANESHPDLYENILNVMNKSSQVLFFNRLNVPKELRELGLGKKLLSEVIDFCKENNYFLINTANNYGEMGQDNLIQFYVNHGMVLIHDDGLLVYHEKIKNKEVKKMSNRN